MADPHPDAISQDPAEFQAWHLPVEVAETEVDTAVPLSLVRPVPRPALVRAAAEALRAAGASLRRRPMAEIIAAIDAAAARLADPADPIRKAADALLPRVTGYSPAMVDLVLDRMTADWRAGPLHRLVDVELPGNPLDAFSASSAAGGVRSRAYGPELCFQVFAGNVPGVAVTSLIRALLVRAPSLGKLATGEPVLPVLFARALATADPEIGRCVGLLHWPGGEASAGPAQAAAVESADTIVVYGGQEATRAFANLADQGQRLVVHGPRLSVGAIGDLEGIDMDDIARDAALAVATFDQQGCVSPHAIWVEDGDGTRAASFAERLARELAVLAVELPRGSISAQEASTIQQERATAQMRAHQDTGLRVWEGDGTAWTVVLDPDPGLRPSCLNRFVRVHPIRRLEELPEILRPAGRYLQSIALEALGDRRERLAHTLARAGITRVTTFRRLPWPPPTWHHDGAGSLRELLRWVDLES